jgi:purine-binding chemotaxis protein CheW
MNASSTAENGDGLDSSTFAGQYLTFRLDGEAFAVPILAVQEIRGWERVSRTPASPDYVLGVINLRGEIVPVLDLRVRLGMDACERTSSCVVIVVRVHALRGALVTAGLLVDAVSDVISISADHKSQTPDACGTVDATFLAGLASVDSALVMLIDLARLVESTLPGRPGAAGGDATQPAVVPGVAAGLLQTGGPL